MKTIPLKDDKWRVFLDTDEYRTLLECAYEPPSRSARQVRLEMRLMACSQRVDTVSGLEYGQFEKRETSEGDRWICSVEAKDSTDREAETRPRAIYIPKDIMEDVNRYAKRKNLDSDELLFKHSTRTIQRDVKRSAENAATKTGNEDFEKMSSHDLRRYFATHLLFRHEVPPPVVRVLGGWKSDDAMFEYLVLPDDVLFERLGEAGVLGTSYDKLARHDFVEKIEATATRVRDLVKSADEDDVVEAACTEMKKVFKDVKAITVDVENDGDIEPDQKAEQFSFDRLDFDEKGTAHPARMTKATYYVYLVFTSWSVTFGSLA